MDITKNQMVYFDAAKAVSKLSDFKRVNVGSVAVYNRRIISSGCNANKTDPLQKRLNKMRFEEDSNHTCHAETRCLKPLLNDRDIDFSRVSVYVYREFRKGGLAMSRPCPSCMELIKELGIKKIYYTGENSYISEKLI